MRGRCALYGNDRRDSGSSSAQLAFTYAAAYSPAPATSPSPPPKEASPKTSIKLGCGCGPIASEFPESLRRTVRWGTPERDTNPVQA
jgi:hypothetical protein